MELLFKEVIEELRLQCPDRHIKFNIGPLPDVCADPGMIRQVLTNLLGNAIKFTRDKHPALVEVGARQEDKELIYYVRDNGAGFDMQYAKNLFGAFQRRHQPDEYEGTGIGLAIVQRIISRHGGRVWCEAEVNSGATCYFALPVDGYDEGRKLLFISDLNGE